MHGRVQGRVRGAADVLRCGCQAANDSVRVEEGRQEILMLKERVSSLAHQLSVQQARSEEATAEGQHSAKQLREALAQETKIRKALQVCEMCAR